MREENIVSEKMSQVPSVLPPHIVPVLVAGLFSTSPSAIPTQAQAQAEGRLCILVLLPLPQHLIIVTPIPSLPSQ